MKAEPTNAVTTETRALAMDACTSLAYPLQQCCSWSQWPRADIKRVICDFVDEFEHPI